MTTLPIILAFLFALVATTAGAVSGGFIGGMLVGVGVTMFVGVGAAILTRRFIQRRVTQTTSQLASALGPQGEALLAKLTNR